MDRNRYYLNLDMYLAGTVEKLLTAKLLNLELYRAKLYFSPEYQNITIQVWKYLVDIRSEAWLNLFLGIHKWKIVHSANIAFTF